MKARSVIMANTVTVARLTLICITAMILFVLLAIPIQLAAQGQQGAHNRYKVVVLGTFGGPNDQGSENGGGNYLINEQGMVTGSADTDTPDPFPSFCFFDCRVSHVFRYENGILTELGSLVPGFSSGASQINARGWIAGQAQTGEIDPVAGIPDAVAVLWKNDQIIALGSLEGGNASVPTALNNADQVVGAAANSILDPLSLFGIGTETRAFLWQDGVIEDLGTLGGPDAAALAINESGQVAGFSYTDAIPTPVTGMPTTHPFLWQNGRMVDLGTLGGTYGGPGANLGLDTGLAMNNRGQVVGASTLAGDLVAHPFLLDKGVLRDLGTLGGDNGSANWINDAGDVVGEADLPGSIIHHAFLWHNGAMKDLGTLGSTSFAEAVNSSGQIVGRSRIGAATSPLQHAFLWEHGGPMVDLNTVIPADANVLLTDACCITEHGEIVATGTLASGAVRTILLIPCGEGTEGCSDAAGALVTTHDNLIPPMNHSTMSTTSPTHSGTMLTWRARLATRYNLPGVSAPRN